MKKIFFLLITVFAFISFTKAQTVQRQFVVMEITTSTGCPYCPAAATGAEDLLGTNAKVAVIEHHNTWQGSDPFVTTASQARCVALGASGNPYAYFDVKLVQAGASGSMLNKYLTKYNNRMNVPSNILMSMDIVHGKDSLDYTATITLTKVGTLTATNMKLLFTVTQSHIHYHWQGQDTLNYVNRLMIPNQNGTTVDFSTGDTQVIELEYTLDPAWVLKDVEFIAFVEDMTAKEVLETYKVAAIDLHPEFTASDTVVEINTPVTFTNSTTGGFVDSPESYKWLFPGATPDTSNEINPTIIYTEAGDYDVSLIVNRGGQIDTLTKTAYIEAHWPTGINGTTNLVNTRIYPNPNNGVFTLELYPVKSVVADLSINDMYGNTLYRENGLNINGKMVKQLNCETLSPGVYFLTIQNAESKTVKKLIVK